jgi:4-hydroxy-tetrahydrodipicolinate synthase
MNKTSLIAAVGTPLTETELLHTEGLEAHLSDQWTGGMTGILVGGTMGAMQMLTRGTYRQLIENTIHFSEHLGEIMVGVGDTSYARTKERIQFLNEHRVDGVVVLSPFFMRFGQSELLDYFKSLAEISVNPLYLYDLPGLTGTKLDLETVQALAEVPNIKGIKCSGDVGITRQLIDNVPAHFRVIVAQADLVDVLLHHGVEEHLDGVFSLAPFWVKSLQKAALAGEWHRAAKYQHKISALLRVLKKHGVFQAFSLILNARGIPGRFMPAPFRELSESETADVLRSPIVQELVGFKSVEDAPSTAESLQHEPAK